MHSGAEDDGFERTLIDPMVWPGCIRADFNRSIQSGGSTITMGSRNYFLSREQTFIEVYSKFYWPLR